MSTPNLRSSTTGGRGDGGKRFAFAVSGYDSCGYFHKASRLVAALALLYPDLVEHLEQNLGPREDFKKWVLEHRKQYIDDTRAQNHGSSPFVVLNGKFLGGCDDTIAFCKKTFASAGGVMGKIDEEGHAAVNVDPFDAKHGYDYDLIVIGGGSGGLACAKEAATLGARVALLDYVKPSPAGTFWGLGGTCVNVGCIPKKLMHQAALLGEAATVDLPAFGWTFQAGKGAAAGGGSGDGDGAAAAAAAAATPHLQHSWEILRENVQNYIRSLNFGYRVTLRDKNVTYLNKHGRFVSPHELEVVDKHGQTSKLTAARFVIAVGGRPQPLNCLGGEYAISSDDLFSLAQDPGKTCVVGAGYVALECAGFLRAFGKDVTVAVRSILLRGFDRECVEKVGDYLSEHSGVKLLKEVTPVSIEKTEGNRFLVKLSNEQTDVFDTILAARGRYPDLTALNVQELGLAMDQASGKLLCVNEQTNVAHVYAVGDVVHDKPELTPVAIQAGVLLARRLFGGSTEAMDYHNVATTVFTPLEYGCVGYSEDDAILTLGNDAVDVRHSTFLPLEWSLTPERSLSSAFAKVLVKKDDDKVVGLHFLGPNAGEVIQGYAVAMKAGLTYAQLTAAVGIHPTNAEEFTLPLPSKSSGEVAKKAGC